MENQKIRRSFERYKYKVPVKISTGRYKGYRSKDINYYSIAVLSNYSRCGAYFETKTSIPPGTAVTMNIVNTSEETDSMPKVNYNANVIWCKKISHSDKTTFGIGLKYDKFGNDAIFGF